MNQHPLSAAFPSMSVHDLGALAEDIQKHGQREPGVLYEGMVLDGWHRLQACERAGLEFRHIDLAPQIDPVTFVLSRNLHRRHLSASQRASAVVACSEWAKRGTNQHGGSAPGAEAPTTANLAKGADVSPRTIEQAKVAHKAGLSEAVKDGKVSVKRAAEIAKLPERQRQTAIAEPATPKKSKLELENESLKEELAQLRENLPELTVMAAAAEAFKNDEQFKRIMQLEAELDAVKKRRDELMRSDAEKTRQISYWKRRAEKAEKKAA